MSFGAADDTDPTYRVAFETGTEFDAMSARQAFCCARKRKENCRLCRSQKTAAELAEKSVSLLKNTDLPLKADEKVFVVCVAAADSEQCVDMLYKAVKNRFKNKVITPPVTIKL